MSEVKTGPVTAGQLMSTPVVAVTPASCDAVPVVDASGALIGLVTSTDLVGAVAAEAVGIGPTRREWEDVEHG